MAIDGDHRRGWDYDSEVATLKGSAYIFARHDGGATYAEVAKLTASDAAASDHFGILRGDRRRHHRGRACGDDDGSGSAYVFRTSDGGATYVEVAKLTAADAASYDQFGVSVAIDGDTIVVGAYSKDMDTGAVYVFRTTDGGATYGQVAKLTAEMTPSLRQLRHLRCDRWRHRRCWGRPTLE